MLLFLARWDQLGTTENTILETGKQKMRFLSFSRQRGVHSNISTDFL
jgi:hypothetical protein